MKLTEQEQILEGLFNNVSQIIEEIPIDTPGHHVREFEHGGLKISFHQGKGSRVISFNDNMDCEKLKNNIKKLAQKNEIISKITKESIFLALSNSSRVQLDLAS